MQRRVDLPLGSYIRVSVADAKRRADASYKSPEQQRRIIDGGKATFGYVLSEIEAVEEDVSGSLKATERSLEDLLQMCECRQLGGIVVAYQDRLSRGDLLEQATIWDRLGKAGARFVAVADGVDSRAEGSEMLFAIKAAMARDEWKRHQKNWLATREGTIADGIHIGKTPFGYKRDEGTRRLLPDAEQAPIVLELFERKARGESVTTMLRWLESACIEMSRSGLNHLLANEVYLGIVRSGEEHRNEEAHEPLISRELYERAQAARGVRPACSGALSGIAALRGLVKCSGCGGTLLVSWTQGATNPETGKREKIPVYACAGRNKGGCGRRAYVRVSELDAFIDGWMLSVLSVYAPVAEAVSLASAADEAAQALANEEHKLTQVQTLDYERRGLTLDDHVEMVKAQRGRVEMHRALYAEKKNAAATIEGFQGNMLEVYPELPAEDKRRFLSTFLGRVVVTKGRTSIEDRVELIDRQNTLLYTPDPFLAPVETLWARSLLNGP